MTIDQINGHAKKKTNLHKVAILQSHVVRLPRYVGYTITVVRGRSCERYQVSAWLRGRKSCGVRIKIRTHLNLLSIPQSGGYLSKRLGGIISCEDKTSSWHLNGFTCGSNIGSTVSCRGETHRYTVHLHLSPCKDTKQKIIIIIIIMYTLNRVVIIYDSSAIKPYNNRGL